MLVRRAVLPAALLLLAGRADRELAFAVTEGSELGRTFTLRYDMELEGMELFLDGEDVSEDAGDMELQVRVEQRIVVTDLVEAAGAGRPARLLRTFDAIEYSEVGTYAFDGETETDEGEYESELEGKQVRFTWDDDAEAFSAGYADGTEEDEALEPLEEDMDLRELLPDGTVAVGDSWEVEGRAFRHLLDPGGDLGVYEVGGEDEDAEDEDAPAELEGTITATFAEIVEEDGRTLARIELAVDVHSEETEELDPDEYEDLVEGASAAQLQWVLAGELLWDLDHGHAVSLELSGEHSVVLRDSTTFEWEGETTEQVQAMHLRGPATIAMRCERR